MSEQPSRELARYVVEARFEDIPMPVIDEAKRSLLNWVGCALGGAHHETMDRAIEALVEFSGPPVAHVLGRGERFDVLHAALLNGMSSHVLDFDDTHLETIIHPTGPVAPALFALSERAPVTGREFLLALVLGIETECRIGKAVYPSHYDKGYHITGTTGVFGAAVAAGKLLGLDAQQLNWALGIASTQAGGLREMFGTMCKPFHPGRASQNGLTAAFLAARGFTSSEASIEAPRGFANVLSDNYDLTPLTEALGESYEVMRNSYKPFACGVVIHPAIDACIRLRRDHAIAPADIERVELSVHPLVLELTGKTSPSTGLEGKFSVFHSAAIALIRGVAGASEYTDEVVASAEVTALRDRVSATVEEGIGEDACRLAITLRDGRVFETRVDHAIGSLECPMTNDELESKFRDQANGVPTRASADDLIRMCWEIDRSDDAAALARGAATA